jgi:hypothetical protein
MYLQARDRCADEFDELALFERFPGVAEADALHQATNRSDLATRWELEARLLVANETFESIAAKIGCTVADISCYESLFYNVRDRLDRMGYLLHHALPSRGGASQHDQEVELVWKLVALSGGALALDDVMHVLTRSVVDDPAYLRTYYREQNRDVVGRQSLIAAITLRARDPMFKLQLMDLNAKYVEIETKRDGPAGDDNDYILDGFQKAMSLFRMRVMPQTGDERPPGVLPNGVELRADQLWAMRTDPNFKIPEEMLNAKFPEIRRPDSDSEGGPDESESLGDL